MFLKWEPHLNENIVAYVLFVAQYYQINDSLGEYGILKRTAFESMNRHTYIYSEVDTRSKYYYKIKAEDTPGNLGAFPDSTGYTLLPGLRPDLMNLNGITDTLHSKRQLHLNFPYEIDLEDYCLTIHSQSQESVTRSQWNPMNYIIGGEFWSIPDSLILTPNQIYKWHLDTGAGYMNGKESIGSESSWAIYIFSGS